MTMVTQESGRIAVAKAIKAQKVFVVLANGDPAQDALSLAQIVAGTPNNANAVQGEFGRRLATVAYVNLDPAGSIEVFDYAAQINRRYAPSAVPTAFLRVQATFENAEGKGQELREVGIFIGGETDAALPPGQQWFTPAQVIQAGDCYQLARMERVTLDGARRAMHDTVIPI